MYLIIFSSFVNSSTDIMNLNQHARPGVTAYVGIDNKRMKYVNFNVFFALRGSYFLFLSIIPEADVVPCGGRK